MKVCFHGFQENVASFEVSGTVSKGDPVKVSANGTVAACAAGDKFCGIALSVRDGIAAVQLAGYVRVPDACRRRGRRRQGSRDGQGVFGH